MFAALKMNWLAAAFPVTGSMLLFLAGVLLMAPDTAFKLAELCAKPFAELFYPAEEFEKPPLSYKLARRYSLERRVEAAVEEYEKILFYYPAERDPYLELIELARRVGDEELLKRYEGLLRKRELQAGPGPVKGRLKSMLGRVAKTLWLRSDVQANSRKLPPKK